MDKKTKSARGDAFSMESHTESRIPYVIREGGGACSGFPGEQSDYFAIPIGEKTK